MGKYEGYMICTDLDGTLTEPPEDGSDNVYISKENCEAIEEFKAGGGLFTFSTGRRPFYIREKIFPFVTPNIPMITVNGASIYDHVNDKILKSVFLPRSVLGVPLEAFEIFRNSLEEVYVIAETEEFCLQFSEENFEEKFRKIISLHEDWYKFVFRGVNEKETLEFQSFLKEKYSHCCYLPRSWQTGQEVLALTATKGERALELKRMFPSVHTLICVGDHENDIPMIEKADKGYAVATAIPSVLEKADFITAANTEAAIAKIISEI